MRYLLVVITCTVWLISFRSVKKAWSICRISVMNRFLWKTWFVWLGVSGYFLAGEHFFSWLSQIVPTYPSSLCLQTNIVMLIGTWATGNCGWAIGSWWSVLYWNCCGGEPCGQHHIWWKEVIGFTIVPSLARTSIPVCKLLTSLWGSHHSFAVLYIVISLWAPQGRGMALNFQLKN